METNNDNILEELKVPDSIADTEERLYIQHLNEAIAIAVKKNLPFIVLTAYDDINKALLSVHGCKHCISKLIKALLDREPDLLDVIMSGVAPHLIDKKFKDDQAVKNAQQLTPKGN